MKSATYRRQWIRWTALLAVLVFIVPGLRLNARQKRKTHTVRRTRHSRRYRHYRRRYVRVRIKAERVRQIQQALVEAGTLHEKPNGRWDRATRDAMKQFQKQNGFTPTGLPEAKPLMKMGLGPHPLPQGLGPQQPTRAEARSQGETETSSNSAPAALKKPTSSN